MTLLHPNLCYNKVCYDGTALLAYQSFWDLKLNLQVSGIS